MLSSGRALPPRQGRKLGPFSWLLTLFGGRAARAGRAEAEAEAFVLPLERQGWHSLHEETISWSGGKRLAWSIRAKAGTGMSVGAVVRPTRLLSAMGHGHGHGDWTRRRGDVNPDCHWHPFRAVRTGQKMRCASAFGAQVGQMHACGLGSVVEASSMKQRVVVMSSVNVDVGCFSARG